MRYLIQAALGLLVVTGGCASQRAPAVAEEQASPAPHQSVPRQPIAERTEAPQSEPSPPPAPSRQRRPQAGKSGRFKSAEDAVTLRAGARRLEAFPRKDHAVRFDGDATIRMDAVEKARGARRLGAVVDPFGEKKRGTHEEDVTDVARAGEIVALALATQLKALRWEVRIGGGQASPAGKARKGARLLRFRFGGEVAFWVKQSKGVTRATVEGKVTVHGPDGGQIHRGAARGTSESRGKVTVRAKRAMGQALHRFVRSVLGDARLGRALVKAIRNAKNAP